MRWIARCMRIFPLALIGGVCLFLATHEMLSGASTRAAPPSAVSSR